VLFALVQVQNRGQTRGQLIATVTQRGLGDSGADRVSVGAMRTDPMADPRRKNSPGASAGGFPPFRQEKAAKMGTERLFISVKHRVLQLMDETPPEQSQDGAPIWHPFCFG
jgi:hypothetical protein